MELAAEAGKQDLELEECAKNRPKMFYVQDIILVRDNATENLLLMGAMVDAKAEVLHNEL